jgi:8-oxo-dGTP pyrophosphatase MutT (NUDIX family)
MSKTKNVICAGGIIINDNKEVVIVNQNYDSWSLPKGHVDPGESVLETAIREIYEETGIKEVKLIKPIGKYGRYRIGLDGKDDKSEFKKIHVFLFSSNQKNLKPIDPVNPEAKWIAYHKVEELLTHPADKKFFVDSIPLLISNF